MKLPPLDTSPADADIIMSAPVPPVALPLAKINFPEVPELVVPDVKLKIPLTPFTPAFRVAKTIDPVLLSLPFPEDIETEPPVCKVFDPDTNFGFPAMSVFDFPTVMYMLPPLPCVDAPVDILIVPLAPLLVVPEKKVKSPLTPLTPPLGVTIFTVPGFTPKPALSSSAPPVVSV